MSWHPISLARQLARTPCRLLRRARCCCCRNMDPAVRLQTPPLPARHSWCQWGESWLLRPGKWNLFLNTVHVFSKTWDMLQLQRIFDFNCDFDTCFTFNFGRLDGLGIKRFFSNPKPMKSTFSLVSSAFSLSLSLSMYIHISLSIYIYICMYVHICNRILTLSF